MIHVRSNNVEREELLKAEWIVLVGESIVAIGSIIVVVGLIRALRLMSDND